MLLTLLLYGYCRGVYSSRKIAAGCASDVAFRVLSGGQFPDFRTVSDFRKNHLEAFQGLFIEVLRLCREAGMVRLGHLSLDGSKYQANASRHKAMSYGRMAAAADQLEAEVQELLDRAAAVDAAEDAEYAAAVRGDELPEELRRRELRRREERLTRIKDAKTRLEERARSRARDESQRKGATEEVAAAASVQAKPQPREPSNFTDPDRRIGPPDDEESPGLGPGVQRPDNGGGEQWCNRGSGGEQPGGGHPPPGADAGDSGAEPDPAGSSPKRSGVPDYSPPARAIAAKAA